MLKTNPACAAWPALLLCAVVFTLAWPRVRAQSYPLKPVRSIVPFGAGGSTDVITRVVGQTLGEGVGQQVIADNRPGAASILGTALAARDRVAAHMRYAEGVA